MKSHTGHPTQHMTNDSFFPSNQTYMKITQCYEWTHKNSGNTAYGSIKTIKPPLNILFQIRIWNQIGKLISESLPKCSLG